MKKVVVTGADGFIGSNLVRALAKRDVKIWALVMENSTAKHKLEGISGVCIVECNLTNLKPILLSLPQEADIFYHFAWQGVSPDDRDDFLLQKENIDFLTNALYLAKKINVKKFVFPGSTLEYLYYDGLINEMAVPSPQNCYASTKLACRYMGQQLAKSLNISFVYTVITSVYGPGREDNNVIFYTIDKLLNGEKPLLTRLEQKWDYVHIDDVSEALCAVGKRGKNNAFYAIGNGDNFPLSKYIEMIRDEINPSLPLGIGEVPYNSDKLPSSCIDVSAIRNDTGFKATIPFKKGIVEVINAIKQKRKI